METIHYSLIKPRRQLITVYTVLCAGDYSRQWNKMQSIVISGIDSCIKSWITAHTLAARHVSRSRGRVWCVCAAIYFYLNGWSWEFFAPLDGFHWAPNFGCKHRCVYIVAMLLLALVSFINHTWNRARLQWKTNKSFTYYIGDRMRIWAAYVACEKQRLPTVIKRIVICKITTRFLLDVAQPMPPETLLGCSIYFWQASATRTTSTDQNADSALNAGEWLLPCTDTWMCSARRAMRSNAEIHRNRVRLTKQAIKVIKLFVFQINNFENDLIVIYEHRASGKF